MLCYTVFPNIEIQFAFVIELVTGFTNSLINLQRQPVSHAIYFLWRPSEHNLNIFNPPRYWNAEWS